MENDFTLHDGIRIGLVILAIGLTAMLFPKTQYFNYNYNKAQKWRYESLVAPFDFSLVKTEDQKLAEAEQFKKEFNPLYQSFKSSLPQVTKVIKDSIGSNIDVVRFIERKFELGIFDEEELNKYPSDKIAIYQNEKTKTLSKSLVYTNTKLLNDLSELITQEQLLEINEVLEANFELNEEYNIAAIEDGISKISPTKGIVKKGNYIVGEGETVTEDIAVKLDSFKEAYQAQSSDSKGKWQILSGYLLLTLLIYLVLMLFLKNHYNDIYNDNRKLAFIFLWPVLFGFFVYLVEKNSSLSTYMIPFCIVPIIILNFYKGRLALIVHIVVILVASFLSKLGYEFTFLQILAGIVTVLFVSETRYWNTFFSAIGIILGIYFLGYLGLELIQEGSIAKIDWNIFGWLMANGILLLLAYPFIPLIEKLFGFTSSITIAELADLNNPLLKELSIKAPGTFQHSLQVSNLSEAAAAEIGADLLLVKTAALYHDVGKKQKPEFFIENQSDGETPHDQLNNFESAKVIIDHVIEGEKLAKMAGLPQVLIDFITTHHGTTRVEYFYRKQLEESGDNFDESLFRYPGPKPRSKEQSILMMADSIEAASKSLKSPTGQDIDVLVDKIIQFKIEHEQLSESELSFKEILDIKRVFKKLLRSIYHVRIEYPEEKKGV